MPRMALGNGTGIFTFFLQNPSHSGQFGTDLSPTPFGWVRFDLKSHNNEPDTNSGEQSMGGGEGGGAVGGFGHRLEAEVLVVHVSRPSGGQMREQEQADGEAAISFLRTKLQEREVAVQTLLMFSDDIARAILNTAAEREVSLIVLGLTGKNILRGCWRGTCRWN